MFCCEISDKISNNFGTRREKSSAKTPKIPFLATTLDATPVPAVALTHSERAGCGKCG